jgi:AraC-like DNA-binding protein/quercetin dioxygenase-like cupin family protein
MRKPSESRLVLTAKALGIPGVNFLGRYRYTAARSGLGPHSHGTSLEICLLAKGCQTYRIGEQIYRLTGGDQFISLPHEVHDTAGAPEERGMLYWLILDIAESQKEILFLGEGATAILIAALRSLPSRHFRANSNSLETLERVFVAYKEGDASLRKLRTAHWILQYLLQTIAAAQSDRAGSVSRKIAKGLEFIAENNDRCISVPVVAAHAELSVPRFKIRFRTEVGVPPAEFMIRAKIKSAQALLSDSRVSVTEVAHRLSFSSSQYFATVFKRYTLQTPSEFIAALPKMATPQIGKCGRVTG